MSNTNNQLQRIKKIVSNAGWIIGCKLIKAILTVIVTIITARYLGPSNYGLINYAASITAFVIPVMKLGIDSTMVHEIVERKNQDGAVIGTTLLLNIASGILCIVGIGAFTFIVNHGEIDTIIVCIVYSISLIFQATEMIQYWFQAKLLSKFSAIAMLISYCVVTGVQILLIVNKASIYWFALSYSIDYALISGILIAIYKRKSTQRISYSHSVAKEMLQKSKYYIVSSLMITIFAQTDRIMLKLMIDNTSVGYYSAAVTCASMFSFVFAAIIDSMRPTIFEDSKISTEKFESSLAGLYSIIIYSSLVVSFLMTVFSPVVIIILYGSDYVPSIAALRLVVWFTTFSYLGTVRNIWIIVNDTQRYLWIINLSGALLNVILNYLLIPSWGILGASFASLMTQIFTNVIIGYIIKPIKRNNYIMLKGLNPNLFISLWKTVIRQLLGKHRGVDWSGKSKKSK